MVRPPTSSVLPPPEFAMGFLSLLCCISSEHTADSDDEKRPRPRDKPPKYNRQNLPSIVVDDPAPWVVNHGKFELQGDGIMVITPPPQTQTKPTIPLNDPAH